MSLRSITDFLVYAVVRVLICVLQALSLRACGQLARNLTVLFSDVLRIRHRVIDENLACAFPQLTADERRVLARQMWEHLLLMIMEIAQAPRKIHETNWRDHITLTGSEALVRALLDDRPTVIVSAHYGNFELSGFLLGLLGFSSLTIARPLDNPYLDRFLHRFRATKRQYIVPKTGSAKQLDALLARGGTLTLLGDQHAGPKGCWVDFFGRPASTHKGIALFALVNDAAIALCYCRRVGAPLRHILGAEATADIRSLDPSLHNVTALTQWYTQLLEQIIRRSPEQYWWVHRRWKDTRTARPSRERAA